MSVYEGLIRFIDRTPIPCILPVGMKGEHNVQEVRFEGLPSISSDQVNTLYVMLPDGISGDLINIVDNKIILTRMHMQQAGQMTCWIVISVNDAVAWKSDIFKFKVLDLPSIESAVEQQYPTALESAIATTGQNALTAQTAAANANASAADAAVSAADALRSRNEAEGYSESAAASAEAAENASANIAGYASGAAASASLAVASANTAEQRALEASTYAETALSASVGIKQYADAAEDYAALAAENAYNAEAFAKGTRNGASVKSDDIAYQNNAKYWAEQAADARDAITDLEVEATTLPEGSSATADYSNGILTIGIPTGASGAKVHTNTTEYWSAQINYVPRSGDIIVYTDYDSIIEDNETKLVPGFKIGDGNAYLVDLPFADAAIAKRLIDHINDAAAHVTNQERSFWNNKLNFELNGEILELNRN